jgi:TorA maturation chaperone TorD
MTTYREVGLTPGQELNERADYIGIEIDYLRHMALQEAAAWEGMDIGAALDVVRKERLFIESAKEWISSFIDRAMEFAQTDFYRGHMQMLRGFLGDETVRLSGMMDEIQAVPG